MQLTLEGVRVLIVEDESIVASLIESFLERLGCAVVGMASRVDDALGKVASLDFDAAILDVNLNGVRTDRIADALEAKGVPFLFATGYGGAALPQMRSGVPVLTKPFRRQDLERALSRALDPGATP